MYGVSTVYFWIMPGKCLDQVGTKFGLVFFIALSQSVVFFTHLLKFYSGGAVDLWSCLFLKLSPDF